MSTSERTVVYSMFAVLILFALATGRFWSAGLSVVIGSMVAIASRDRSGNDGDH